MDEIIMYKGCEHVENITDAILTLAQDTGVSRVVPYAPDCVSSTKGAMYLQEVLSIHGSVESGVSTKEGMYVDAGDWSICGVPALVCSDVVTTLGLGDTLTAGIFYHELKRRVG